MGAYKKQREFQEFAQKHVRKSTCVVLVIFALMAGAFVGNTVTMLTMTASGGGQSAAKPETVGQNIDAEQAKLEAATISDPDNPLAWARLGHYYFDHDMPGRAVPAYEKSLELDPEDADIWSDLGVMYRRTGAYEKAVAAFDRATVINPEHRTARFNKGIVLMHDLNDTEGALASWRALIKVAPNAKTPNGRPVADLIREVESQ